MTHVRSASSFFAAGRSPGGHLGPREKAGVTLRD